MADNVYTADAINQLTGLLSGAIQAQAMRPQKTSTYTTSSSTTTPYALADMVANRDRIGQATRNLNDALRARESLGYTLANSLANIPQQQGYGSWLTDFARSLGGAWGAPTTMAMDRAQKQYENEMKDLATILAYDKAMGDTTTQRQSQVVGYTPMEYGTGGAGAGNATNAQQIPITNEIDWDYWIKNWDADRPTEKAYRGSELGRSLQNWGVRHGQGTAVENEARQDFTIFKDKNYLPMARNVLKGSGPITDFEDAKYTRWLSNVYDPVQLKDLTVRIIMDVGNKNGWSDTQKRFAMEQMGVLSNAQDLLPSQIQQNPLRVKNMPTREEKPIVTQTQDSWTTLSNGIRIRKK